MNMKLISNNKRKRLAAIDSFLKSENISLSSLVKIKSDASFRNYFRIKNTKLILMDADPKTNEKISSFIKIHKILSQMGIRTPRLYKKSISLGLMIIEDFGSLNFLDFIEKYESQMDTSLYSEAIETLMEIHRKSLNKPWTIKNIKKYTFNEQIKETELYFDWYLRKHIKIKVSSNKKVEFYKILKKIYKKLCIKNYSLVLRDFHVDNIIPFFDKNPPSTEKKTIRQLIQAGELKCTLGIIDFQDALIGSPAYDLCSLVEDVRAPMNISDKESLIEQFIFHTKNFLSEHKDPKHEISPEKIKIAENTLINFKDQISYFSIQRNLKILGIFSRLKYRDKKTKYIKYLPAAKRFVRENLKKPQFEELKAWFAENKISV